MEHRKDRHVLPSKNELLPLLQEQKMSSMIHTNLDYEHESQHLMYKEQREK